jgi:hypothetical protein
MTAMPGRELNEGGDIVRALRQSRRIRPVRSNRAKILSPAVALLVLSGALVFAFRDQLPPTSPQVADVPELTTGPTGPPDPQATLGLRGTLPTQGGESQSVLNNDGAPVPSTAEPVSPPETSPSAISLREPPPIAEQAQVREPDEQTSTIDSADQPDTRNVSFREPHDLLLRAEQLLQAGDLAAARLLFERVVAAGDLRGADGLARSYDPDILRQLPVYGRLGDPATAARWRDIAQSRQANPLRRQEL